MKKKLLLNSITAVMLSVLPYHAIADDFVETPKTPFNKSLVYPEHIHEDYQPLEKSDQLAHLRDDINNAKKGISDTNTRISYIGKNISDRITTLDNNVNSKVDDIHKTITENRLIDKRITMKLHRDIQDLDKKQIEEIKRTDNSINTLNDTLTELNLAVEDNNIKGKKYTDDKIIATEEKLADSEIILNSLIEDAVTTSKSHTDLTLRSQQMLNINRFDSIESQYDKKFDNIERKIAKNAKRANAGIASVAAMSNIPYSTKTRFSAGIGLGNYKSAKAIAAGAQYQLKQNLNLRGSISWNNASSPVIGAGIAFGW
ncbi:MAG: YadA C-terminal domain-containing protein [Providencia heimbachae]|nr:YadA C-terminal domain-containing protein [Providencia heimbachae]